MRAWAKGVPLGHTVAVADVMTYKVGDEEFAEAALEHVFARVDRKFKGLKGCAVIDLESSVTMVVDVHSFTEYDDDGAE